MMENKQIIRLKSQLSEIHKIEAFIEKLCEQYQLTTTYYGNILIAITEAVSNAILHGNKLNQNKIVTISFEYLSNGFRFSVEDEGEGFDYINFPDPTDITKELNGRGIYLIKTLSDNVEFSKGGTSILIDFSIENFNRDVVMKRIDKLRNFSKHTNKDNHNKNVLNKNTLSDE